MYPKMAATLFRALAILCPSVSVFVFVGGETFLMVTKDKIVFMGRRILHSVCIIPGICE